MIEVVLINGEKKVFIGEKEIDILGLTERINVEEELLFLMDNVEHQVVKGKTINKIYLYEGIEMYNFYRGSFYVNIKNILSKYLFIYELFTVYKDEDINITTDDIVYKDIINNIFNRDCKYENIIKKNMNSEKKIGFYIKVASRIVRGSLYLLIKLLNKNKKKTLFITQASDVNKIEINNKVINYDSQFGYLLEELKNKKEIVRMQFLNNQMVLEKANKIGIDFLPYELFVLIKKMYSKKQFDKSKVENSLDLLSEFNWTCKGKDLSCLVKEQVITKMEQGINSYIDEIITARLFIKELNIDTVFATDEADRARCIIWAANEKNLKTYALQHGIIAKASSSYIIPTKAKGYVPNKTFLWGKVYKKILMENTYVYNNDNLVVVGQPRTDYLIKKIAHQQQVKNGEKIKVLYASQYVWDLTKQATEIFINAIKDMNNVEVIIKLHPGDKYEDFYKDIVRKNSLKNVRITKNLDIYEAIIWCDLIVSIHSTVVLEGAILNKPSICILLEKYYDQGNFVKDGLSKGAKDALELRELITSGNYANDHLQEYVEKSFYKVDGKVTERILKNIIS